MERSTIVIRISKINRIIKTINYLLELETEFDVRAVDPELDQIGMWIQEITEYWRDHQDAALSKEIQKIGRLREAAKLKDDLPGDLVKSLDHLADLQLEVSRSLDIQKGVYHLLPDDLANAEAAALLKRAVKAGILDKNYQPTKDTTMAQLRILAGTIGKILELPKRKLWKPFEHLWHTPENYELRSVYIARIHNNKLQTVRDLYPEVIY